MNLKSIDLSFSFDDWVDDSWEFEKIPFAIAKWADLHAPHRHSYNMSETDDGGLGHVLTVTNVPASFATFAVLSGNGIQVIREVGYAPIHPLVEGLFDFGDDK